MPRPETGLGGRTLVFNLFLTAVLTFSPPGIDGAQAAAECTTPGDDHGNCASTATLLTDSDLATGRFLPGNIEASADIDFFSFGVTSDQTDQLYVIETSIPLEDPFSDTFLRLIDTDGVTPLVSDDNQGEGNGSKLTWSPEVEGTYFVEVTQLFPEDVGLYSVSVFRAGLAPVDDHSDQLSGGTLLLVNDLPTQGSMELSGDRDAFQFIAEPGNFYDIETSSLDTGSDTILSLYDSDGESLLGTDDQGGREFNASRLYWLAPDNVSPPLDVFYLAVDQFLESKSGVGYSLSISSSGTPPTLATDGTVTSGFLENPGDADAYVFGATQNYLTTVDLATLNSINNFRLRLLDIDGISLLLEQKNLEFEDLAYQHTATGAYTLVVTEPYLGMGYSLSATSEAVFGNPDLNGDGKVDLRDVLILMESYQAPLEGGP